MKNSTSTAISYLAARIKFSDCGKTEEIFLFLIQYCLDKHLRLSPTFAQVV